MAAPRVFLSSTCYDLGEVRDSLFSFIESYCYQPILSDRGDVFYHPDLHTHTSCTNEIENCELFVLIIGGRFGGKHIVNKDKSIVNAEYSAAKALGIPVFTFVKRDVYEDHRVYERNKSNKALVKEIVFPSMEKQEYAANIFEFINDVRLAPVNNGLFPFDYARDIRDNLGKQWAGLLFDFLNKRSKEKEIKSINHLLDNLSLAGKKTEELIENIYKHLDKVNAPQVIKRIDEEVEAAKFFQLVFRKYKIVRFEKKSSVEIAEIKLTGLGWFEFLEKTGDFKVDKDLELGPQGEKVTGLVCQSSRIGYIVSGYGLSTYEIKEYEVIDACFKVYKKLSKDNKVKVLAQFSKE